MHGPGVCSDMMIAYDTAVKKGNKGRFAFAKVWSIDMRGREAYASFKRDIEECDYSDQPWV